MKVHLHVCFRHATESLAAVLAVAQAGPQSTVRQPRRREKKAPRDESLMIGVNRVLLRAWAKDNGYSVPPNWQPPDDVVLAYRAFVAENDAKINGGSPSPEPHH